MSHSRPASIYLDHNASTPILPEVVEAMRVCWTAPYLNPASQHSFGRRARGELEEARERLGELLGAKTSGVDADRVIFTSGGTEANNLAVLGLANASSAAGPPDSSRGQLIISAVEHPSITAVAEKLAHDGWQVERLPVDQHGVICVDSLTNLLCPETRLVAVMLGQNETGVLQPVTKLAKICGRHSVAIHTDAAQVAGKLPVEFRNLGVTTMTVAAHKFHGPLGVGALVVRYGTQLQPQFFGGFQQAGLRPGTESVALAVGMCRALELWHDEQDARATRMRQLRDGFESTIVAGWPGAVVIGAGAERLPHTSHIAFVGLDRQALFMMLDQRGVACSTGSACASGSSELSPVLRAMGCEAAVTDSALRFSLGATTTPAEIAEATGRILGACNDLRRQKEG